jgi:hypothetical protein
MHNRLCFRRIASHAAYESPFHADTNAAWLGKEISGLATCHGYPLISEAFS